MKSPFDLSTMKLVVDQQQASFLYHCVTSYLACHTSFDRKYGFLLSLKIRLERIASKKSWRLVGFNSVFSPVEDNLPF